MKKTSTACTHSYIFTSESVTEGHPDKVADAISDGVLDYVLKRDKKARVAVETLISNGICVVAGELKTEAYVPLQEVARGVLKKIGYNNSDYGCDYRSYGVLNGIGEQSKDISQGVDKEDELGAGDQGLMFGYACNETPHLMPLPITLAHALTRKLTQVRKDKTLPFLRPDGKAQVSVKYINSEPVAIDTIVISTQHDDMDLKFIKEAVYVNVIEPVLATISKDINTNNIKFHINPAGRFVIGGPQGDAGLTGRKIIVDTYGGSCPHGGGAFSGKDPTKVDRSAAYAARYVAKNLVKAGIASRCTVQLSYAIGLSEPISVYVDTHGTSDYEETLISECVQEIFDLTPQGIIDSLNLLEPIYSECTNYGHFGNSVNTWEQVDKVKSIQKFMDYK